MSTKTVDIELTEEEYQKLEEILKELNEDEDAGELVDLNTLITSILQSYIEAYVTIQERERVLQ